jgi:hypothetical protein
VNIPARIKSIPATNIAPLNELVDPEKSMINDSIKRMSPANRHISDISFLLVFLTFIPIPPFDKKLFLFKMGQRPWPPPHLYHPVMNDPTCEESNPK